MKKNKEDKSMKNVANRQVWLSEITTSILAGVILGVACIAYIKCLYLNILPDTRLVGSIMFSFGLTCIVLKKYSLYTGKVGYLTIRSSHSWLKNLIILIMNFIGIIFTFILFFMAEQQDTELIKFMQQIVENKISQTWYQFFIKAIGCGIIIYVAVDIFKKTGKLIGVLFGVPIFILCGFEHCIANSFFFLAAPKNYLSSTLYLFINIVGNAIGSIFMNRLEKVSEK